MLSDGRRTDHFPSGSQDRLDLGNPEPIPGGELRQQRRAPGPLVAKVESRANGDMPAEGNLRNKLLRGRRRKGLVKVDQQAGVQTLLLEEGQLVRGGSEQGGRLIWPQDANRMGVKCQCDSQTAGRMRFLTRLADDALVAEMDTIKNTDGEVDRPFFSNQFSECAENFHRTQNSLSS